MLPYLKIILAKRTISLSLSIHLCVYNLITDNEVASDYVVLLLCLEKNNNLFFQLSRCVT